MIVGEEPEFPLFEDGILVVLIQILPTKRAVALLLYFLHDDALILTADDFGIDESIFLLEVVAVFHIYIATGIPFIPGCGL